MRSHLGDLEDRESWGELLDTVASPLQTHLQGLLARYRIGSVEPPEDLTQEVLLEAWRRRGKFAGVSVEDFVRWTKRIAFFKVRNLARSSSRHAPLFRWCIFFSDLVPEGPEPVDRRPRAEKALEEADLIHFVLEALCRLPTLEYEATVLVQIRGMRLLEAARRLSVSKDAVRKRVSRGLERVRHLLNVRLTGERTSS